MERRRVFVTGIGLVAPHGQDPEDVFERVYAAESAVRLVGSGTGRTGRDALLCPVQYDPFESIPKSQRKFMARASQMAVVAATRSLERANLEKGSRSLSEAGIYLGCSLGGSEVLQNHYERYFSERAKRSRIATTPMIMANGPASHMSMLFDVRGPTLTYSVACVSSTLAIGEAFRAIRDGYLDCALTGGAEAQLNTGTVSAWHELGVLATEHASGPAASSRPFDSGRTGLVLGEGAALLVLESEQSAQSRGAEPLAEVVGYGTSSDAYNLTAPHPDGQWRAMSKALVDGEVDASQVGYINAHATGTLTGDPAEAAAIKRLLGDAAGDVPVSSTKAVHGHLVGAAGGLEAALTVRALQTGRVPPTAHLTDLDPECGLDCVPIHGRAVENLEYALSNSFAFGGTNATLLFRRV